MLAAWLGSSYRIAKAEASLLHDQGVLAETAAQVGRVRAEAQQIVAARQIADLERRATEAQQRLEALAASSGQISRQLADARNRVDALTAELRMQGDVAELRVATLVSKLNNSPDARAVAVWNPAKQEGLLVLDPAPPIEPGQKLELWVIEAKVGAQPISAGVLAVNSDGTLKARFKPRAAVGALATFAVSREKDDGARFHAQPADVVMAGGSR